MMSKKQWLALLTLFIVYLLLGAAFFYKIESEEELQRRIAEDKDTHRIQGLLKRSCRGLTQDDRQDLADYCQQPRLADFDDKNRVEVPYTWDFYNSVFFVITVVSTIGYGNLHPSTALGRLLMILYALIGIPMNGIVLATMAEYFSSALLRVHRRYKTKRSETRAGLVADVILYLIPGFVIFIFLPTGIFMHFEDWTFDQSLYYAFVTLTTIGFGDLVAGQTDKSTDVLHILYKILLLIWIIFGLGYLVMILGFITRAMRSKKVARLEHKLAANLKHTQSKIWSSFTRDVTYLRRVLNEMYVMRIKPVYKDEEKPGFQNRPRSSSEPMLYVFPTQDEDEVSGFGVWRRRANSETAVGLRLPRVLSESDLERIDKVATFQSRAALIQPEELLAHVVNALGGEDTGIQGFSDGDILASEEQSTTTWSIGDETIPRQRTRTASDVRIPIREQHNDAEWTWSGDQPSRRIHELIRARRKSVAPENQNRRRSIFQIAASRLKQPLKKRHKAKSIGDLFVPPSPPERRQSVPQEEHNYFTHTSMHPALEETTLADFLRAMSSLHSRIATPPDTQPLRRKKGTASLSPPGSLLSLFTPPANNDRRMSLRPTPTPRLHTAAVRRASLHPSVRRFSVRPVNSSLPYPPPPPPPPIRLMAPHLFSRQISDPSHRRRASSITDQKINKL